MRRSVILAILLFVSVISVSCSGCKPKEQTYYTVSFYNGVTLIASDEVEWGALIEFPASPTKESDNNYYYIFKGWATSIDSTEVVSGDVRAYSDITYYAIFIAKPKEQTTYFTVTFIDDYTGEVIGQPQQIELGGDAALPTPPDHSQDGYYFVGWSADNTNIRRTTTIRALYQKGSVTIKRHYLGQTRSETVTANSTIPLDSPTIPSAFVFEGWYFDKDFTRPVSNESKIIEQTDIYAKISVDFSEADLTATDELVYGNDNIISISGLKGEDIIEYTFDWAEEDRDKSRSLRNAGTYDLEVEVSAVYKYNNEVVLSESKTIQKTFIVDKAQLSVTLSSAKTVVYGTSPNVNMTVEGFKFDDNSAPISLIYTYSNNGEGDNSQVVTGVDRLQVGYYTANVSAEEMQNYYIAEVTPINFTVLPKDISIDFNANNYIYGSELKSDFVPYELVYNQSDFAYDEDIWAIGTPVFTIENPNYNEYYPTVLNAGNYTVTLSGLSSDNYNINFIKKMASFSVTPFKARIDLSASDWTYGETEKISYTTKGVLDKDIPSLGLTYSFTKNHKPTTYNYRLEAGEYTVYVTHNESSNYDFSDIEPKSFTVNKAKLYADITLTNANNDNGTYVLIYGTRPEYMIKYSGFVDNDEETLTDSVVLAYYNGAMYTTSKLEVGDYTIVLQGLDTLDNYNYIENNNKKLTVQKRQFNINVELNENESERFIYGIPTSEISGKFNTNTSELVDGDSITSVFGSLNIVIKTVSDSNISGSGLLPAGKYYATVDATAKNYDVQITPAQFDIDKAALSVSTDMDDNLTLVYGQKPDASLIVSGFRGSDESLASPSLVYINSDKYNNNSEKFPVGTYSLKVEWGDDSVLSNYEWSQLSQTITIDPKPLTLNFNVDNVTYGEEVNALYSFESFAYGETVDEVFGALKLTYNKGGAEYSKLAKYFDAGDYTATLSGIDNSNYVISNNQATTVPFTVFKKVLLVAQNISRDRLEDWTLTPTFTSSEFDFSGTLRLNTNNVGTYVWNKDSHDKQINWISGYSILLDEIDVTENFQIDYDISVTLLASQFKFTPPINRQFSYDGKEHLFEVGVDGILYEQDQDTDVNVEYSLNDGEFEMTVPSIINAGEYQVNYRISADNYKTEIGSFTVTVNKGKNKITTALNSDAFTYDGIEHLYNTAASATFGDVKVTVNGQEVPNEYAIKNAGEYNFLLTVEETNNYEGAKVEAIVTVGKAELTATVKVTNNSLAYGQNPIAFIEWRGFVGGEDSGVITNSNSALTYYLDGSKVPYVPTTIYFDAGSYRITAENLASNNYNITVSDATIIIAKKTFTIEANRIQNHAIAWMISPAFTGGDEQLFKFNGTLKLNTSDDGTYIWNNDTRDANFVWDNGPGITLIESGADVTVNFDIVYSISITLNSQQFNVTVPQNTNLIYDGEPHKFEVSASLSDGAPVAVKYKVNGGQTTPPEFTNVGTYTIYYELSAEGYVTETDTFTVTISQAINTISASLSDDTFTYNGKAKEYSIDATALFGDVNVSYSYNGMPSERPELKNAGVYKIIFASTDDDSANKNYLADTKTITITIEKADFIIEEKPNTFTYNGTLQGEGINVTSMIEEALDYSVLYTSYEIGKNNTDINSSSPPKFTTAGRYKVNYSITDVSGNYNDKVGFYSVVIAKADVTIDVSKIETEYTYTANRQVVDLTKVAISKRESEIQYSSSVGSVDDGKFGFTNVVEGNGVTLTITVPESPNYNKAERSITITVNRAEYILSDTEAQSYIYNGSEQGHGITVSALGQDRAPNIGYIYNGKALDNIAFTDVGNYKIDYNLPQSDNYNGSFGYIMLDITKAMTNTISGLFDNDEFTFDGDVHSYNLNAWAHFGEVYVTVNEQAASGTKILTDAGEYVFTFTVDETSNYVGASATRLIKINKADYIFSGAENQTYDYNGSEQGNEITVTDVKGQSINSIIAVTTNEGKTSFINAGSYTVDWEARGNQNYNSASGSYTITINKLTLTPVINQSPFTYNATYQGRSITVTGAVDDGYTIEYSKISASAGTADLTTTPLSYKYAGEYTAFYRITGDNYIDVTGSYKTIITPKEIRIVGVPSDITEAYSEAGYTLPALSVDGVEEADKANVELKLTITKNGYSTQTIKDKGIYTVSYSLDISDEVRSSYKAHDASGYFTVTITGITVTLDVSDIETTYTYNGREQTVDLTKVKVMSDQEIEAEKIGELQYSVGGKIIADGKFKFTNVNEADGVSVTIRLVTNDNSNYSDASETIILMINRAPYTSVLPQVNIDDEVMRIGKTLKNIPLSDGYSWKVPDTELTLGEESYGAVYTDPSGNYLPYDTELIVKARQEVLKVSFAENVEADFGADVNSLLIVSVKGEDDRTITVGSPEYTKYNISAAIKHNIKAGIGSTYLVSYSVTYTANDYFTLDKTTSETYLKLKSAQIGNDSTLYTIEDALNKATSGDTITLKHNTSFASEDVKEGLNLYSSNEYLAVKEGVTLLLPYDGTNYHSNVAHTSSADWSRSTFGNASYLKLNLTIPSGITLTNNGNIRVGGITSGGNGGSSPAGQTAGDYAQITLGAGAKIESYGDVTSYGFIVEESKNNSSAVTMHSGTLTMPFVVVEHRGGSVFSGMYLGGFKGAPFNRFYMQNITPMLRVEYGANLWGRANLYASSKDNETDIKLVGNGSDGTYMIMLKEDSFLTAKYDIGTMITDVNILGSFDLNALSLSVAGQTAQTNKTMFPISWYYRIKLSAGSETATVNATAQDIKILPGGSLTIDEGVTATIKNLFVSDSSYMDKGISAPTYDAGKGDGTLIINGTLNANNIGGYVQTIGSGAALNVISSNSVSTFEVASHKSSLGGLINTVTWDEFKQTLKGKINNSIVEMSAGKYISTGDEWIKEE
ncbi:MAG: InlB B-repeat-containing protein [Clostridiales bacterium]|nr:InlB B-repeat-containing protein [Clostridiales bacterium]